MRRRDRIIQYLTYNPYMTCSEICQCIITDESIPRDSNTARYLTGGVSSLLSKMVKEEVITRSVEFKGLRGGYVYCLPSKSSP